MAIEARPSISEAKAAVRINGTALSRRLSFVRDRALSRVNSEVGQQVSPIDLILANRTRHLDALELRGFVADILAAGLDKKDASSAPIVAVNIDPEFIPLDGEDSAVPLSVIPFNTLGDPLVGAFREVFRDEDTGLLRKWMKQIDVYVDRSSRENLAAIDNAAEIGKVEEKDVIIVGGGPLSAFTAAILGGLGRKVTLITSSDRIGEPWRSRPLYINSSAQSTNPFADRFPLIAQSTTTPISPKGQLNNLDTDVLVSYDTKRVACDDGTFREYASGPRFGDLIATQQVFNIDDFIVGQTVLPKDVNFDKNTEKSTLEFVDKDGVRRKLRGNAVFFAPGPGKEIAKFNDQQSNDDYVEAEGFVDDQIVGAKNRIASLKRQLIFASGNPELTNFIVGELKKVTVAIPRILTLSMIEKLYSFWFSDLDSDPDRFPLAPLFDKNVTIGNIGGGDNTNILEELVKGRGPKRAYPKDFNRSDLDLQPQTSLINVKESTPDEFDATTRRRYNGLLESVREVIGSKAQSCQYVRDNDGNITNVQVVFDNELGLKETRDYDYAFVATGLTRDKIEDDLPMQIDKLFTSTGTNDIPIGLGNILTDTYILGSGTGFTVDTLPTEISEIIKAVELPKTRSAPPNTVALWVWAYLTELVVWEYLNRKGVNREKVNDMVSAK